MLKTNAIYKALEKFQYLLYNRHFLLETDNKNLTFLNTAIYSRVHRWKLAIQRYAFNIRHVVGELNVVADAFQDVYLIIIAPKLIRFKLWRRWMKSYSQTSSIIPLGSFITLLLDMQGSSGQLSECIKRGFRGPTYVNLSERTFACAQFVRR